ncbi:MAG: hypothetical protein NT150_16010 [Bacteroidetes bacterium]|nr:hypothetical protein [Bacteroidota bacterium]
MKVQLKVLALLTAMIFTTAHSAFAQKQTALQYLELIGKEYDKISKDNWKYTRTVAHSKSARKVESSRKTLVTTTMDAKNRVSKMAAFEGDASYRDAVVKFLQLSYDVLQHDYAKIMDMEEVAEQSYDGMEAYLLAQKIAGDKMEAASDELSEAQKKFAGAHNITLVENTSDVQKKMAIASQVFDYYNVVYLIFFKSFKQEAYLIDALNKKDVAALEQNKSALMETAKEGLAKLDTMKAFKGDRTVVLACQNVLKFYLQEAQLDVPLMIDMIMKADQFEKVKKSFDAKAQKDRTKEDVDQYNKMVADMNAASNKYNVMNDKENTKRNTLIDTYNAKVLAFTSKFVPED